MGLDDIFNKSNQNMQDMFDSMTRKKAKDEERENRQTELLEGIAKNSMQNLVNFIDKKFDVFVSHASENKIDYVTQLKNEIKKTGARVWYDEESITWGDSLTKTINHGLENCHFGIVVLSKEFFEKEWCKKELQFLIERQKREKLKIILPLLYEVNIKEVATKYGDLADLLAIESEKNDVKDIAILFSKELIKRLRETTINTKKEENNKQNNEIYRQLIEEFCNKTMADNWQNYVTEICDSTIIRDDFFNMLSSAKSWLNAVSLPNENSKIDNQVIEFKTKLEGFISFLTTYTVRYERLIDAKYIPKDYNNAFNDEERKQIENQYQENVIKMDTDLMELSKIADEIVMLYRKQFDENFRVMKNKYTPS